MSSLSSDFELNSQMISKVFFSFGYDKRYAFEIEQQALSNPPWLVCLIFVENHYLVINFSFVQYEHQVKSCNGSTGVFSTDHVHISGWKLQILITGVHCTSTEDSSLYLCTRVCICLQQLPWDSPINWSVLLRVLFKTHPLPLLPLL